MSNSGCWEEKEGEKKYWVQKTSSSMSKGVLGVFWRASKDLGGRGGGGGRGEERDFGYLFLL